MRVFTENSSLVPEDSEEEEESGKQMKLIFTIVYLLQIVCKHSGSYHYNNAAAECPNI